MATKEEIKQIFPLLFFVVVRIRDLGSRVEKNSWSGARDKHPGSATLLHFKCKFLCVIYYRDSSKKCPINTVPGISLFILTAVGVAQSPTQKWQVGKRTRDLLWGKEARIPLSCAHSKLFLTPFPFIAPICSWATYRSRPSGSHQQKYLETVSLS